MPIIKLCQAPCCCRPREHGSKYCVQHREKYEAKDRERDKKRFAENAKKRGNITVNPHMNYYTSTRWRQLSSSLMKAHPYCEICGRSDLKLNVHHNYPKFYDYYNDHDFYDKNNLVVVCTKCHEQITHTNSLNNVVDHTTKYRFDFRKGN